LKSSSQDNNDRNNITISVLKKKNRKENEKGDTKNISVKRTKNINIKKRRKIMKIPHKKYRCK